MYLPADNALAANDSGLFYYCANLLLNGRHLREGSRKGPPIGRSAGTCAPAANVSAPADMGFGEVLLQGKKGLPDIA